MKALSYKKFGSADQLEWADGWPVTEPKENEVLINVHAGGLNPKDILLRKGKFSKFLAREPLPRISGLDIAGVVVKTGSNCTQFSVGDKVFGMSNRFCGGVHAEYALLPQNEIALMPNGMSMAEAAAIPLAAQTALQALRDCAALKSGSQLLINGASGGVGHFAVQIAKAMEARITAVCSRKNFDFVKDLGAQSLIDYSQTAANKIQETFDCVFDVFGQYCAKDFKDQLGKTGVYVSTVPKFSTLRDEAFAKIGFRRKSRLVIVKSVTEDLEQIKKWVEEKKLQPFIEKTFSFADAADAHRHIESKRTKGKVVLINTEIEQP